MEVIPTSQPEPDALAFVFRKGRILLADGFKVPLVAMVDPSLQVAAGPILLGRLNDRPCYAIALDEAAEELASLEDVGLREVFARLTDPALLAMASRASQTLDWWFGHAYCGKCGSATHPHESEMARHCPSCGALHFPRINPAVITLVHRNGDELLLASDRRFRTGFYALLAGFVEPGETLEEAVAREVREEVGIEVGDLRYFGSQAWPFPSQLMVGFFAAYRGGEIAVQESELTDARWFHVERMPDPDSRPPAFSIAGRLIAQFLEDAGIAR